MPIDTIEQIPADCSSPLRSVPAHPPGSVWPQLAPAVLPSGHELASWGSRFGAWLVDLLVVLAPLGLAVGGGLMAAAADGAGPGLAIASIGMPLWLLALLFYAPLTMARRDSRNGQTWGKQLVGIRVVRDTGAPYGFGAAMQREVVMKLIVFNLLGIILIYVPFLLNYLWPLWDQQDRALHDMATSSHVVKA